MLKQNREASGFPPQLDSVYFLHDHLDSVRNWKGQNEYMINLFKDKWEKVKHVANKGNVIV